MQHNARKSRHLTKINFNFQFWQRMCIVSFNWYTATGKSFVISPRCDNNMLIWSFQWNVTRPLQENQRQSLTATLVCDKYHETFEQLCFLDKYRIAENIYLSVLIDIQKHWLMQAQTFFIKVQSLTNSSTLLCYISLSSGLWNIDDQHQ